MTIDEYSKACCTLPPVVSEYTPKGKHVALTDAMDAYVVGPADAKRAVVFIYDIFGYHPATEQVADLLAYGLGARVVMPDLFLGKPCSFPLPEMSEFRKWISERGSWEAVGPNVTAAVQYAKQHGGGDAVPVGVVGLCWGAQVSVHALKELSADVYGAVLIHPPARLDPAEIEVCARPLAVLPSKDEGDFSAIEATLKSNAHSKLNVYRKFDDMHHGWCGARADFENELNRQRTHEAVQLSVDFFRAAFA